MRLWLLLLATMALACHGNTVHESLEDADANLDGAGTESSADGASETGRIDSSVCNPPGASGPKMARIAAPTPFCIDVEEVRVKDYLAFVAASPKPTKPYPCSWNSDYGPAGPQQSDDHPVTGVDWCDAYEYCRWAGKSLCGAIADGWVDHSRGVSTNQWSYACANGSGATKWPFGNEFSLLCNIGRSGAKDPVALSTAFPDCHGRGDPFDLLVHMSGNVAEWDMSCNPPFGKDDKADPLGTWCGLRGGAFNDSPADSACPADREQLMKITDSTIGFRCCRTIGS